MIEYKLDLMDGDDLCRIKKLLDNHYDIMRLVNEDSEKSPKGGAMMYYEISIKLKEVWS